MNPKFKKNLCLDKCLKVKTGLSKNFVKDVRPFVNLVQVSRKINNIKAYVRSVCLSFRPNFHRKRL